MVRCIQANDRGNKSPCSEGSRRERRYWGADARGCGIRGSRCILGT
jgi:hypothetical protein